MSRKNSPLFRLITHLRSGFAVLSKSSRILLLASVIFLLTFCVGRVVTSWSSGLVLQDGFYVAGWTSDGSMFLVQPVYDVGERKGFEPLLVSVQGSSLGIVNSDWDFRKVDGSCIRLSPDGRSVLFTQLRDSQGLQEDIYRVDTPGETKTLLLTRKFGGCPAWSPDSQQIVFPVSSDDEGKVLRIVSRDGQHYRDLLSGQGYIVADVAWSPDGQILAFVDAKSNSLMIVDTNGDQPAPIVDMPDSHPSLQSPTWSPNSQFIAYIEGGGGGGNLVVIRRDGTGKRYLYQIESFNAPKFTDYLYSDPVWSPSGGYIAASRILARADYTLPFNYEIVLFPVPDDLKK